MRFRLGVDGGGTGCRARLVDGDGRVLGEGRAGPANLSLGVELAREAVLQAAVRALSEAGLGEEALHRTHAGLGLAAGNVAKLRLAFEGLPLPFASAAIRSDAETACLGAHGGKDGAILILGTGSQGVLHRAGCFQTVGGWGFALSDAGSGAIMGRAAVRRAFAAHEGVEPASAFTAAVLSHFGDDRQAMLEWAAAARPREWGEFAPMAFEHAARGDAVALELVRRGAREAEQMMGRLVELGARRLCLMGGLAQPIRPYLSERFTALLSPAEGDALDGALLAARPG